MANRRLMFLRSSSLCGLSLLVACSHGGSSSNPAPRVDTIPQQRVTSGTSLALDLAGFVHDRAGGVLSYAVRSGGGSFVGSNYHYAFPTMGSYTVEFTVSDAAGQQVSSSFDVVVTTGNFAVVCEGTSGLLLVDTNSDDSLRVSGASSGPTFAAGFADGRLVYQLSNPQQLWVFDPMARNVVQLLANATGDVSYVGKTTDNRVVFTEVGTTRKLHVYNPRTQLLRSIAEDVPLLMPALMSATNLVYFTVLRGGQGDVAVFDPSADTVMTIAATGQDERVRAVLPNGGLVLSRVGSGGEQDLYYYRTGTGLVEVASSVTALDTRSKTCVAVGLDSQVIFTATDSVTTDLYSWSPVDDSLVTLHAGGVAGFAAIGAGNEVIYTVDNGAGDVDAFYYDLDDGSAATLRNGADTSMVLGIAGDTARYALIKGSSATSTVLAVQLTAAPNTITHTASGVVSLARVLTNGNALLHSDNGTEIATFNAALAAWSTMSGTGMSVVGDGIDAGDFVYTHAVGAQVDLVMWDQSASAPVAIATMIGDGRYQATSNGKVYWTSVDSTGFAQLFVRAVAAAVTTQLTQPDAAGLSFDHSVVGTYSGSR